MDIRLAVLSDTSVRVTAVTERWCGLGWGSGSDRMGIVMLVG